MTALCVSTQSVSASFLLVAAHLGAQTGAHASTAPIAFTGATLIDGTGTTPVAECGHPRHQRTHHGDGHQRPGHDSARGAEPIALNGKFIIPGLINSHGHVNTPDDLRTYAVYGVTTVVSLGGENEAVFAARASQNVPIAQARARVRVRPSAHAAHA